MAHATIVIRSAKIDDLDLAIAVVLGVDENVLWFEVAMRDVLLVAVGDGLQDLLSHEGSVLLVETSTRTYLIKQFMTVAQLCH